MREASLFQNVLVMKIFRSPGFLVLSHCRHFLQLYPSGPALLVGQPPSSRGKYTLRTQGGSSQNQPQGRRSRGAPGIWFLVFRAPSVQVDSAILCCFQTEQPVRSWLTGEISLPALQKWLFPHSGWLFKRCCF